MHWMFYLNVIWQFLRSFASLKISKNVQSFISFINQFFHSVLLTKNKQIERDALDVLFACNLAVFKDEGELCQC